MIKELINASFSTCKRKDQSQQEYTSSVDHSFICFFSSKNHRERGRNELITDMWKSILILSYYYHIPSRWSSLRLSQSCNMTGHRAPGGWVHVGGGGDWQCSCKSVVISLHGWKGELLREQHYVITIKKFKYQQDSLISIWKKNNNLGRRYPSLSSPLLSSPLLSSPLLSLISSYPPYPL